MTIAILAGAATLVQLFVFLCAGSIIMRLRKQENYSLGSAMLLGWFAYFSVFEAICLVFELKLLPLSSLSLVTGILMAAVIAAGTAFGFRRWRMRLRGFSVRRKMHGFWFPVLILVIAASCIFALLYTDASADSDYYVGMASAALYTNTIGRFDPTNGRALMRFKARYAFSLYPYHNAVMAYLFRIPAVVQARSVMSVINVFLMNIGFYRLGLVLFTRHGREGGKVRSIAHSPEGLRVRRASMFVCFLFLLNVFSSTIYLPGIFLFTRSYEGKSLIVNGAVVCALAVCVMLYQDPDRKYAFRDLFWITCAGVCFSASVLFVTALTFAALIPLMIMKKKWKILPGLFLGNLPVILWAGTYFLAAHGRIVLRAVR